ncbi:ArsR/SmtB family transcription factor [Alicyclobacillus mengziensis]|uniref:Winged helix-turn-helix transcriptional regulator n=1 Tax=Alicyclobacillus mengziensis TaxID=2931921 RepID=A0A9X7Z4M2_9BACL|nr:metalloregulator ArsR/SmtB family transcription factor [Alicyclobacillus mengziensis]QSO45497.1 winged helix-turn-helix transcriptional regulator [Alicyclobacillus mengziensis]
MPKLDMCQVQCVDTSKVERLRSAIPDTDSLSVIFKAVSDATRLKVAFALATDELCVCEVAALLDTTVQNASHHLRWLKRAGLATFRKDGKLVYYRLLPAASVILNAVEQLQRGENIVSTSHAG